VVLEERFRQFVIDNMQGGGVLELDEDQSGNFCSRYQVPLAKEFLGSGWQIHVDGGTFLQDGERRVFYELVWAYIQAGILRLTISQQTRHVWAGVYLTQEGLRTLQGATPIPEDVEDYLVRLKTDGPALDETAVFYVREALLAFGARLFPSAVVMLGCAAEHLVVQMANGLLSKLPSGAQAKLKTALERDPISTVWSRFRERFESYRTAVFAGEVHMSEVALDGLFLAVKAARDDGGHPRVLRVGEAEVRPLLQAFLQHAKAASRVLTWEKA